MLQQQALAHVCSVEGLSQWVRLVALAAALTDVGGITCLQLMSVLEHCCYICTCKGSLEVLQPDSNPGTYHLGRASQWDLCHRHQIRLQRVRLLICQAASPHTPANHWLVSECLYAVTDAAARLYMPCCHALSTFGNMTLVTRLWLQQIISYQWVIYCRL